MSDTASTPTAPAAPSGERRQVTALFADMVGFTAISERLGEEGTFALIQPIYELMAGAVKEQGGSVKDFTGDGIMALFGVPEALEDAPLRACRAGLLIHERLAAAAPAIEAKHGVRPQMRIGVNSGLAVVTQIRGESAAMTALGDTVNLASRLQTLAEPGTVYLSEATQRLVQGLVETTFAGAHAIKGKAEPQKVYRLDSIRQGATRFEAAVGRGLSAYVGREREMEILERAFAEARGELRVIDIVAEPGMGKSRLLHEFRQRVGKEQAFILTGSCSPDGRQTPFLPFIEVVRGSFQVRAGEAESEVARKLEMGLTVLGLHSPENLGLLLNLLGLKPPEGALAGLDGVLIGLRTRDLVAKLAGGALPPLAGRAADRGPALDRQRLARSAGQDRRWRGQAPPADPAYAATGIRAALARKARRDDVAAGAAAGGRNPAAGRDAARRRGSARGAGAASDRKGRRQCAVRRGNPELPHRARRAADRRRKGGIRRRRGRGGAAGERAEPADRARRSARAARPRAAAGGGGDRPALRSAIARRGRRTSPATSTPGSPRCRRSISSIPKASRGDYAFKHALVRDALYQSLLTGPRAALHLKIAEEIERRSGNRLAEVVETLAHHYGQTDRADKAFAYLAMAGAKSLRVYSFDEAGIQFAAAIALLDANPGCAGDHEIVEMLSHFALYTTASWQMRLTTATVDRFRASLERVSDSQTAIVVQHHYVIALMVCGRYRDAESAQARLSAMAARLGDAPAIAYAHSMSLFISAFLGPRRGRPSRRWPPRPLLRPRMSTIPIFNISSGARSAMASFFADARRGCSPRLRRSCPWAASSTIRGR